MSAAETASPFDDVRALVAKHAEPDADAAAKVRARLSEIAREGDFGKLGEAAAWLAGWQRRAPPRIENPTLAMFAGAHGVAEQGVSITSQQSTREQVDALREGRAPLSAIATQVGVNIRVFELALDKPTPSIAEQPAMSEKECAATIAFGFEALAGEPDIVALGVVGAGIGTTAAALACALYGGSPEYWVKPAPGAPPELAAQRSAVVSKALARHRGHITDPLETLRCLGGREIAACVGAIIAAGHQGVPVLVDGFATTIAAGIVHALNPNAIRHVRAAHVTKRPSHDAALERVGLEPLLNLGFQSGGGLGSTTAVGVLKAACAPFIAKPAGDAAAT
ncbi:MAG: nicotinate-nucleotide--dimethylbenzimidazole phosphoribosyltransferase [Pseudomonadota bacterium]